MGARIYSVVATTNCLAATASPSCHQGPLPVAQKGLADLESVELLKKPSEIYGLDLFRTVAALATLGGQLKNKRMILLSDNNAAAKAWIKAPSRAPV